MNNVKTLFSQYAQAMEDGKPDNRERKDLIKFVETFLHNLLQAERECASGNLDR